MNNPMSVTSQRIPLSRFDEWLKTRKSLSTKFAISNMRNERSNVVFNWEGTLDDYSKIQAFLNSQPKSGLYKLFQKVKGFFVR